MDLLKEYLPIGISGSGNLLLFCKQMSGIFKTNVKRAFIGLMICVMGAMMVNKAVYFHVHILPDGTAVTHAHPFNKNSETNKGRSHHHSNVELFLFHNLELLFTMVAAAALVAALSRKAERRWNIPAFLLPAMIPVRPGRAPPVCM